MDFFSVLGLFGGLAFFLYGMFVLSSGLEKMAGGNLERTLKKMTDTKLKGLVLGAGVTIALQSSSTLTVILVGLVNSGMMNLNQTVGPIMGSHIGTTLTAWILSLSGIESSEFFLKLLKPENFSPILAFIGIIMVFASKNTRRKDIGEAMLGFAVLMYGMKMMSSAVAPLADDPGFAKLLVSFSNPVLAVLVGAGFTGIIQSSAASIGILQAFALTGTITYKMAIPIIMGQNIGTCATALIASIGVSRNAKRVGVVHIMFSIIGTVICMILFYAYNALFPVTFLDNPIDVVGIAAWHSIFNVFTTIVLYPFSDRIVKLATVFIKEDQQKQEDKTEEPFIDEILFKTPSVAISECNNLVCEMANLAEKTVITAIGALSEYSADKVKTVNYNEELIDLYEDRIGTYLVKLSSKELSDADSARISIMLHTIGDFERIGDHALNLIEIAQEIHDKKIVFSGKANYELNTITAAMKEIIGLTISAFTQNDTAKATNVEPLEQVIDALVLGMRNLHIERLKQGICTIELGFVFTDILTNYERISDHCSNVAVAMIEVAQNTFGTHEYISTLIETDNKAFKDKFAEFLKKYPITE